MPISLLLRLREVRAADPPPSPWKGEGEDHYEDRLKEWWGENKKFYASVPRSPLPSASAPSSSEGWREDQWGFVREDVLNFALVRVVRVGSKFLAGAPHGVVFDSEEAAKEHAWKTRSRRFR